MVVQADRHTHTCICVWWWGGQGRGIQGRSTKGRGVSGYKGVRGCLGWTKTFLTDAHKLFKLYSPHQDYLLPVTIKTNDVELTQRGVSGGA